MKRFVEPLLLQLVASVANPLENQDTTNTGDDHHPANDYGQNCHPVATPTSPEIGVQYPQSPEQDYNIGAAGQTDLAGTIGKVHGSSTVEENNYLGHAFVEDNPYAPGGIGCSQSSGGPRSGVKILPSGAVQATTPQNSGGAGQRLTGKFQSVLGSLVGSNVLKDKGLQKEQEANAVKVLTGAEREELMHRERAVGHSSHPANCSLGAK